MELIRDRLHRSNRDWHLCRSGWLPRLPSHFHLGDSMRGGYRHSSSRSRRTAALTGFFDLSHALEGPERYGASSAPCSFPTFFCRLPYRRNETTGL